MLYSSLIAATCVWDVSSYSSYALIIIIWNLKFPIKNSVNRKWETWFNMIFSAKWVNDSFKINSKLIHSWLLHSFPGSKMWADGFYHSPSHLYSHNKLYYCMSDHSPPSCKYLECLGCESERWIVVYWYIFSFVWIFSYIFWTTFPSPSLTCHVVSSAKFHGLKLYTSLSQSLSLLHFQKVDCYVC